MERVVDLIRRKRDGEELTFEDYEGLISGYARGEVKRISDGGLPDGRLLC